MSVSEKKHRQCRRHARALGVSQSALGHTIRGFEEQLDLWRLVGPKLSWGKPSGNKALRAQASKMIGASCR
jgi:hypothetical protein